MIVTDKIIAEFPHHWNFKNVKPFVESFWNFSAMLKNPNFVFMQQMAFVYLYALISFRREIRTNDYDYLKILGLADI